MNKSQHAQSLQECRKLLILDSWHESQNQDDSQIRHGIQNGIWVWKEQLSMSVSQTVLHMNTARGYRCDA